MSRVIFVLPLMLVVSACSGYGPVVTTDRTVEQGSAHTEWAAFQIHTGSLSVSGGAAPLMDARFTANRQLQPAIDYRTQAGQGWLTVAQPDVRHAVNFSRMENRWDVRLSNTVPIDVNAYADSGDTTLDLTGLQLTHIGVTSRSGDITLTAGGEQRALSRIDVDSSSGRTRLSLGGSYDKLTTLKVNAASGDVTLDLSGQWHDQLSGEIRSSSGNVTIRVPRSTPAIINAGANAGAVAAHGFRQNGGRYTTDAYAKASAVITLDVTVAAGHITLEQIG